MIIHCNSGDTHLFYCFNFCSVEYIILLSFVFRVLTAITLNAKESREINQTEKSYSNTTITVNYNAWYVSVCTEPLNKGNHTFEECFSLLSYIFLWLSLSEIDVIIFILNVIQWNV
jgi:hypothetical protein